MENATDLELKVLEVVKAQLAEELKIDHVELDSNLIDLGMNSILYIKIIVELEEKLDFEFDDNNLVTDEKNVTTRELARFIKEQLEA